MSGTVNTGQARQLCELVAHHSDGALDGAALVDSVRVPAIATTAPPHPQVVACNTAFAEMCGYTRDDIVGGTPEMLQGPETDREAAHAFVETLREKGRATTQLVNYRQDGSPYQVSIHATRVTQAADASSGGPIYVAFEEPIYTDREAVIARDDPRAAATGVENILRCVTNLSYRRGMPPSQWAALRYFARAHEGARNLTAFARQHQVTMGTASSTVSSLVNKGYLVKHAFRGPIEITEAGESMLADDPMHDIVAAFAEMPLDQRVQASDILAELREQLDCDGGG
ncbi:PAS domain S-box-containing protein [Limimonas halophila]|uniref:PAS domain S-box-containing protein n=1 Tax=Limimonas halophila TaxID=1082479 RepID=A0A1G7V0F3_9PROT|nr:PAS domain-containing protein [Limimonas halophila]SDG53028.1 PAS domain S-box-containing protein [Limimonas halophila]